MAWARISSAGLIQVNGWQRSLQLSMSGVGDLAGATGSSTPVFRWRAGPGVGRIGA
jgi:hypothetical protein